MTAENGHVRKIQDRGALLWISDGARENLLLPEMIRHDHMVGECCAGPFDCSKESWDEGIARCSELVDVEFGKQIVDIEDHLGAHQFGQPGGEYEEVRNGMNMKQIIAVLQVPHRQEGHGSRKEEHQS